VSTAQGKPPLVATVATALTSSLQSAAKGNSHTAAPAAAVLWPDKERQWQAALPSLKQLMPGLFEFGAYDPESRSGPAVWLKCAVAGVLPEVQFQGVPVVYLPGVSRAELRAIESCPRELQPLAELQYRGVLWSQINAKDWTVSAFLASKNGGLGLEVAQDKATQEALAQVLAAGVLLDRPVDELKGRQINAEWLLSLLAPNPTRDLLVWMNAPQATQKEWTGVRWEVFCKRAESDFGFDPVSDGPLVAAEKLARRDGKWAAVAELYRDSYTSFPEVLTLLRTVQPPQMGLFPDMDQLAGYPQANEQGEASLRYALSACAAMDAAQDPHCHPGRRERAWRSTSGGCGPAWGSLPWRRPWSTWPDWPSSVPLLPLGVPQRSWLLATSSPAGGSTMPPPKPWAVCTRRLTATQWGPPCAQSTCRGWRRQRGGCRMQ